MVEPHPKAADTQFGDCGGVLMLSKEVSEAAEESIVPGDRFGTETFAGVVESETFNQCLNFHEKVSSHT